MAEHDNDIFVIITLWLLYIGIHVCMDFFERRARSSAEAQAAEEAQQRSNRIIAVVDHDGGSRRGSSRHGRREIHVVVVGAETDAAGLTNAEPCDGALVPDANGNVPQPPAPVQYGEAAYAPRLMPSSRSSPSLQHLESEVDAAQLAEPAVKLADSPVKPTDGSS